MRVQVRALCAAAMIAVLTGPAHAQGKMPQPPPQPPKSQQEIENDRKAEQAYRNSLKNIPDQAPADPWGIARGAEAPKASGKTAPAKPSPKTGTTAN